MINRNLSILVVEDNDGDFVLIEDYLIDDFKTIQLTRFVTLSEFLRFLQVNPDFKYDLLLLDMGLPDLSGIALIEKVLSANILVPIIILTGFADLSLAKESLKLGVEDFLIKDEVTPSILHKSIEFAFSRTQYVKQIQVQNQKLRNIAWTQSHEVRAPLARILGSINLIEIQNGDMDDLMFWIDQLKISTDEMDAIVRKISDECQQLEVGR